MQMNRVQQREQTSKRTQRAKKCLSVDFKQGDLTMTEKEAEEALSCGFKLYPIEDLPEIYNRSCPLRFISYWDVSKPYICPQGVKASFKE